MFYIYILQDENDASRLRRHFTSLLNRNGTGKSNLTFKIIAVYLSELLHEGLHVDKLRV